ncbi:MAG: HAMP domain-containing histidine kinase [Kiritimatiellae bacterium]|nr:HAMP domain-containing histidine kinase [Kiritimatiellia bacterium]
MTKEFRIFAVTAVLPAVLGTAAGIFFVRTAWQKMLDDERRDLEMHAGLMADALMSRVIRAGFDDPYPHHGAAVSRHPPPPRHLKEGNRTELRREDIVPLCSDMRAATRTPDTAFEIQNIDGSRFFAEPDWPGRHDLTGRCDLGPPLGDKELVTARVDGGADFRFRRNVLLVSAVAGSIFLTSSIILGAFMLLHMLRHERRDARAKADFFDNVSHELKTPLAGIRLNAELLSQGRIPNEELRRGALDAIMVESDRLTQMVDRLLDFSRVEKGTYRYRMERFDLAEFVGDAAELQAIAAISNGRARVSFKSKGTTVVADKNAVRQIGINLVTNAVKYSKDDIDIEVEGCEIRYMDRGPGIPHGEEERIFERFHRVDNQLTASECGSGLGLAIARGIAKGMGGDVAYSRRDGGGSVFTLSLRRAEE